MLGDGGQDASAVSQGATGNRYIDGLLRGSRWESGFAFSFPQAGRDYGVSYGSGENTTDFRPLTLQAMEATRAILGGYTLTGARGVITYGSVASLILTPVGQTQNGGLNAGGDIRLAESSVPRTAYAYFPADGAGGDAWFGTGHVGTSLDYRTPVAGSYAYHTYIHELGHALGLKHGHETGGVANVAMPTDRDGLEFTVMTYRSYPGGPATPYTFEQWGAPQTLMMYDILALQVMYGADYATHAGNTTYRWNPATGEMSVDGIGQGTPGGNRVFLTIWDGGGADVYDLSNYTTAVVLDLAPGGWSITSEAQRANLGAGVKAHGTVYNALMFQDDPRSLIENAIGGSGNDTLRGNDLANWLVGNAGNDQLFGGNGDDTLRGGAGSDLLDGGAGFDIGLLDVGRRGTGVSLVGSEIRVARGGEIDTGRGIEALDFVDGRLWLGADSPAAQILRLYQAALHRMPDPGGLHAWSHALAAGGRLDQVAQGFLGSDEFAARFGRGLGGPDFVNQLYHNVLGREAEASGLAYWTGILARGALTRDGLLVAFSESQENMARTAPLVTPGVWELDATAATIARIYDTALGRVPELNGLAFWQGQVAAGGLSLETLGAIFAGSAEFRATYGALDNRGFTERLYWNALDRAGDAAGIASWSAALDAGNTRAAVMLAFSESPEHMALTGPDIANTDPAFFGILFA
ncbi:DUF4214 domain-containing protein [Humitalea rosea]|uniref:DUF4214 domain-containing protein n=1 Tax=Humitalea rosea TaxID=990373 RepID=UPI001475B6C4|nr:DUF4214 domain-containing protein [Humitalea rosea]